MKVNRIGVPVVIGWLILGAFSLTLHPPRLAGDEAKASPSAVVRANTAFATDLYAKVRAGKGNLIVSPINISAALMMAQAGASGDTEAEMAAVLHLPRERGRVHRDLGALYADLRSRKKVKLTLANALWVQRNLSLVAEYEKRMKKDYGAEMKRVDFILARAAARQAINRWTETRTNGKIKDAMPRGTLGADTRLVLSSAIYFKGTWKTRFQKKWTKDEPFHLTKDKTVNVPMMQTKEAHFRTIATKELHAIELPYAGRKLAMLVILPAEVDGLDALEQQLTPEGLKKLTDALVESEVKVFFPRFGVRSQFALTPMLREMGMKHAFSPGADFSGISDDAKPLFVQRVLHGAFIEVDEKGTEAGGVTHVTVGCGAHTPAVFRADHPFLFLIRDRKTGSILFMGRIVDPRK